MSLLRLPSSPSGLVAMTMIALSFGAACFSGGSVSARRDKALVIVARDPSTAPRVRLNVAAETMAGDDDTLTKSLVENPLAPHGLRTRERDRRRLRESVRDLERILTELGVNVWVRATPAATHTPSAKRESFDGIDVFVGRASAEPIVGPLSFHAPADQAFRVVVRPALIALYGESDLASSYAVYELLHQMGCRWFIPGPLGEVLPNKHTPIELRLQDEQRAPSTIYRSVWFADDAWKRRNREGGLKLEAGHALETYLTDEERAQHPEWTATIQGKPEPGRLRWSSPTLAAAIGDRLLELHSQRGSPTFSISPNDGSEFDDSAEDRALDAGDVDPSMGGAVSLTDRFVVLANRIATHVTAKQPDVLFGFLAYVQYTRPPVRERLHPNLIPQIAPITYARAHPMSDDRVPGNRDLRQLIERWGSLAKGGTSIYFYGYFLAELVAPNPMLTKWGNDVPFVLQHNAKYWQPETLPNFETSMHALYMGMQLAFDARRRPSDVYADLDEKLYGAAAGAMHDYWREVDRTWVDVPEYAGGMMGHLRRFTPERLARLRALIDRAKRAAANDLERKRIEMADDSLSLFEEQMSLRRDYAEGRFQGLARRGATYREHLSERGEKWKGSYAFIQTYYAPDSISAIYYDTFMKPAYEAVTQIAETQSVIATLRNFRMRPDDKANTLATEPDVRGARFDDRAWPMTDVAVDSWSSRGLHDYLGSVAYRAKVVLPPAPPGKHVAVTLSMVDGSAAVFINGRVATLASTSPSATFGPLRFDVTSSVLAGENTLTILVRRQAVDELGVGGLMGPVVIHSER